MDGSCFQGMNAHFVLIGFECILVLNSSWFGLQSRRYEDVCRKPRDRSAGGLAARYPIRSAALASVTLRFALHRPGRLLRAESVRHLLRCGSPMLVHGR